MDFEKFQRTVFYIGQHLWVTVSELGAIHKTLTLKYFTPAPCTHFNKRLTLLRQQLYAFGQTFFPFTCVCAVWMLPYVIQFCLVVNFKIFLKVIIFDTQIQRYKMLIKFFCYCLLMICVIFLCLLLLFLLLLLLSCYEK